MERRRPSSSKSSKKHSSKQNSEKASRITRSMTGKSYRKFYCEDSSSDEMSNTDSSQTEYRYSYVHLSSKEETLKEEIQDDSSDELSYIDVEGTSLSDSDSTANEKSSKKETSSPATLPRSPDLPESGSSLPFRFWGNNAFKPIEPLRRSGSNLARQEEGTENVDEPNERNASKNMNKEIRSKEWEKWRIKAELKKQIEKIKEPKRPKKESADDAGKKIRDEDSSKNSTHVESSSTAVYKGIPKRRSDPGNALKENRPRTST